MPSSDAERQPRQVLFGTFTGVFTPTVLTIFGVIMYVRIGWSVGNAGLAGTWLVMGLAITITAATALSLSSIATNTRVGAGGPYAIMSHSLGFDIGGSIGVPLYLTRPLGVAMYIIGFREGWLWIFADHPPLVIDVVVFVLLLAISYVSANLAFRVQFFIMAIIAGSLVSIFAGSPTLEPAAEISWWGAYPGFPETGFARRIDFWHVFAVFFPATTGILAGANMSGDLEDPRRAIPSGTLWALGVTSVVYLGVAWWCARAAPPEELVSSYTVVIDKSLWPPIVLAGLLGATASSALAGLVGGPRILAAMGDDNIIPYSKAMAKTGPDGNPRAAIVITGLVTFGFLMMRDLNLIAPLVTMFFLITYCMLNVVVLVESSLKLVSFRPTLRLPRVVPLVGLLGCIFSMFIVQPTFGLVSIVMVFGCYRWMQKRVRNMKSDDVRSSVFVAVAQWAASRVTDTDHENLRAWKPNLLVPVKDSAHIRGRHSLLTDLTRPDGSITLVGLEQDLARAARLRDSLTSLSESLRSQGVQASAAVLRSDDVEDGVRSALEALQAAFFRPNLLFINLGSRVDLGATDLDVYREAAASVRVGMLFVALHPEAGLGLRRVVRVWVQAAPGSWKARDAFSSGNLNLNLLTGYRLMREWGAALSVVTVLRDPADADKAEGFLAELCDLARLPSAVERRVVSGSFRAWLRELPPADVNILGLPLEPKRATLQELSEAASSTCIFVWDSGRESALE